MQAKRRRVFLMLVTVGVLLRIAFVLAADSRELTFLSGGSDAPIYDLLARNLLEHKGLTYAGLPSAFRPPVYPLIVAGFIKVFGENYITALRWVQFIAGLLTVWVCARIARRLFGSEAEQAATIFGLFLPTLIFSTDQVLTECLAALLTAVFLWCLVDQMEKGEIRSACGMGLTSGLGSLIRFNVAAMPLFGMWAVFRSRYKSSPVARLAAVALLPMLIVLPWLVRNEIVFHGRVLYSTQSGANAMQGVLTPEGRTQPGETDKLKTIMGWAIQDLQTNQPARLTLPSEDVLERQAMKQVPGQWKALGWRAIPLLAKKVGDFWLSTDQLIDTKALPPGKRAVRMAGVAGYLVTLAFGALGWIQLRKIWPEIATIFFIYAAGFTVMHLPLVMNTRLRIPLMEPLIVALAGGGWTHFLLLIRRNGVDLRQPAEANG